MKREEIRAKMKELNVEVNDTLVEFIMAEHGKEIQAKQKEYDDLVSKHATEKEALEAKAKGAISKEEHQKVLDELTSYKGKEETSRRSSYLLDELKTKKGYEDLVAGKVDWSKASYDETKKTYTGDEFIKQFDSIKKQYPDLFEPVGNPNQVQNKGYVPKNNQGEIDLTKI